MHAIMTKDNLYLFQYSPADLFNFTLMGITDVLNVAIKSNDFNECYRVMKYLVLMAYVTDSEDDFERFTTSKDCDVIVQRLLADPIESNAFVTDACTPLLASLDSR